MLNWKLFTEGQSSKLSDLYKEYFYDLISANFVPIEDNNNYFILINRDGTSYRDNLKTNIELIEELKDRMEDMERVKVLHMNHFSFQRENLFVGCFDIDFFNNTVQKVYNIFDGARMFYHRKYIFFQKKDHDGSPGNSGYLMRYRIDDNSVMYNSAIIDIKTGSTPANILIVKFAIESYFKFKNPIDIPQAIGIPIPIHDRLKGVPRAIKSKIFELD